MSGHGSNAFLRRMRRVAVAILVATACTPAAPAGAAPAPCDSIDLHRIPEDESPVQIGVRFVRRADSCSYVYTVWNRGRDTLTAVQVGYDAEREACELTGMPPHVAPDTAYSPLGWECLPVQAKDPTTFGLGWRLAAPDTEEGGILPGTVVSGFRVDLPRPDSLYERCHWLVRFRGFSYFAHVGSVVPERELEAIGTGVGTIVGTITDERGAGIPGATVTVARDTLGAYSNAKGGYAIANVPAGAHRLVAHALGFESCGRAHVRVATGGTTRVAFVLHAAAAVNPCTPYATATDRLGIPFPGDVVDTAGARRLDRREGVPPRTRGDRSKPRMYLYSLTSREVDFVYRGLGADTVARAFVATVHRNFRDAEEERLVRIAEETFPPREAVLAVAESRPGRHAPTEGDRLWWYDEFDGVRLPYAVTLDAVRYYLRMAQAMGRGDSARVGGLRMKRCKFSYSAGISDRPSTYSRDGRVFHDVIIVDLHLSWSDVCGSLCACSFQLDRTVVLRQDGTVLCVFGDREPMVIVS